MGHMNHDEPYSEDYIGDILSSVKTIAMVGASPDKTKFSYGVLRVLHETGYDIIPVNPRPGLEDIRGLKVYASLAEIDRPVDMVDVFRKPEDLPEIARQAVEIGASVLWGQIGVVNHEAARLAEDAGLKVVMNRCPKIELFRPFWKPNSIWGFRRSPTCLPARMSARDEALRAQKFQHVRAPFAAKQPGHLL